MSQSWDREISILERDAYQLVKQASRLPQVKILESIESERAAAEDNLGAIAVSYERGMSLIRKPSKVMGRASSAILYWAKQHFSKLKSLTDEFMHLQNRKMWLRLLQERFSDSKGQEQTTLEARHLVDLVHRRQHLARMEKELAVELKGLADYRRHLRKQYDAVGTADQNWKAANTMSARLGVNVLDAKENPSTLAMNDLMKYASIPLRHPAENKRLMKLNTEIQKKSDKLVEQCSALASDFVTKGHDSVNTNSLNQFKNMINQVEDLRTEASKSMKTLLREQIQPARPKIVQNAAKQDKTIQ